MIKTNHIRTRTITTTKSKREKCQNCEVHSFSLFYLAAVSRVHADARIKGWVWKKKLRDWNLVWRQVLVSRIPSNKRIMMVMMMMLMTRITYMNNGGFMLVKSVNTYKFIWISTCLPWSTFQYLFWVMSVCVWQRRRQRHALPLALFLRRHDILLYIYVWQSDTQQQSSDACENRTEILFVFGQFNMEIAVIWQSLLQSIDLIYRIFFTFFFHEMSRKEN